jgi:anti-anti-sigma factor
MTCRDRAPALTAPGTGIVRRMGSQVVPVDGEVDLATVPALRDRLLRAVTLDPGGEVVVDLDGVTVLDDTAMGVLLGAAARARELGGDLVIVCTSTRLLDRLRVTRLDRAIEVRDRWHPDPPPGRAP